MSKIRQRSLEGMEEYTLEPNWTKGCELCDQTPTVELHKDGELEESTDMCGVCYFGSASMRDPDEW